MKPKHIYRLTEGEPLSAGCKKNECRNERRPVGAESESHGRAEIRLIGALTFLGVLAIFAVLMLAMFFDEQVSEIVKAIAERIKK